MKAILIDTVNRTVTEVDAKGLQDYYRLLNCDMVEVATHLGNEDVLYVDEEGLFKQDTRWFKFKGGSQPYKGNGIVVGTNVRTGNTIACKSDLETIKRCVEFLN